MNLTEEENKGVEDMHKGEIIGMWFGIYAGKQGRREQETMGRRFREQTSKQNQRSQCIDVFDGTQIILEESFWCECIGE